MSINKYKQHKNIHHILTKWQVKKRGVGKCHFRYAWLKRICDFGLDMFRLLWQ